MRLDVHHHLMNEAHYVDNLVRQMDRLEIERVGLSGLGLTGQTTLGDLSPGNAAVCKAYREFPDRIIPFASFGLGRDVPDDLLRWLDQGFLGVKVTRPRARYDDAHYDPIYEIAQARGVPVLFHTGVVLRSERDAQDGVTSDYMRPITLDRVARTFPRLTMVIAHLGMPWHEEAAAMLRVHPNVYADVTFGPGGWLERPGIAEYLRQLLYWPGAVRKLVFGTDVHWSKLAWTVAIQETVLTQLSGGTEGLADFRGLTAQSWWNQASRASDRVSAE